MRYIKETFQRNWVVIIDFSWPIALDDRAISRDCNVNMIEMCRN